MFIQNMNRDEHLHTVVWLMQVLLVLMDNTNNNKLQTIRSTFPDLGFVSNY